MSSEYQDTKIRAAVESLSSLTGGAYLLTQQNRWLKAGGVVAIGAGLYFAYRWLGMSSDGRKWLSYVGLAPSTPAVIVPGENAPSAAQAIRQGADRVAVRPVNVRAARAETVPVLPGARQVVREGPVT